MARRNPGGAQFPFQGKRKGGRRYVAALARALVAFLLCQFLVLMPVEPVSAARWQLVIEVAGDGGQSTAMFAVPLADDGAFVVSYRHSVERTVVFERFVVDEGVTVGQRGGVDAADGAREANDEAAADVDAAAGVGATGIVLVGTEYESFGAGLPTAVPPGARFTREGDRFVVDGLSVPIPSLTLRPLALTEHAVHVGSNRYPLSGRVPDGTPVRLRVQRCYPPED